MFEARATAGLTPVLVHVDTSALHYYVDQQRSTYSGNAAIVIRIRDGHGREVQKLSQQYALSGEAKDLDAAKRGEILFYREPDLAFTLKKHDLICAMVSGILRYRAMGSLPAQQPVEHVAPPEMLSTAPQMRQHRSVMGIIGRRSANLTGSRLGVVVAR